MLRRVLCAIAVLSLLAGGCTKEPEPLAAQITETPSPTETPPPPPPPVAALTGEELPEPIDRPVLAVKIDNASAALPPDGIDAADVVFEEEVEGGLTRFLALFHSTDPGDVGPIRSGRESDVDLLPQFQPVVGFSGAAGAVASMFRQADLQFYEEGEADGAFYRDNDRIAPHDLFAEAQKLWAQGDDLPRPEKTFFEYDDSPPASGQKITSVMLTYSVYQNATWSWADDKEHWEREQNGSVHATAQGRPITADNVVIMRVKTAQGSRTDVAGNPTVELDVIGKGKAVYLRDGELFRGRWRKDSRDDDLQWLDTKGKPFPLRPGQTWIQVLSADRGLDITKGGGGGSD